MASKHDRPSSNPSQRRPRGRRVRFGPRRRGGPRTSRVLLGLLLLALAALWAFLAGDLAEMLAG